MKDHRIGQLESLVDLLKNLDEKKFFDSNEVKKQERIAKLDRDHLDTGYYSWNEKGEVKTKDISDLSEILDIKRANGTVVKLTPKQVADLKSLIKVDSSTYKKAVEASKEYTDKGTIKGAPVELKATVSAVATFEASWEGIKAELKIEAGTKVTFGKEGGFQYSAELAASAKVYAQVKRDGLGVSAEVGAEAAAEAKHTFTSKDVKLGKSDYAIAFYSSLKAYAKAEAKASAGMNLNPMSKDAVFGASAGAWAGFGIEVELGIQIKGIYDKTNKPDKRLLANVDAVFAIEIGVGTKGGGMYAAEEITIGKETYNKRSLSIDLTFFAGASVKVEFALLAQIEGDLVKKIEDAVKERIQKILGKELYDYIEKSYDQFKTDLGISAEHTWNVFNKKIRRAFGDGNSYATTHLELQNHIIKLEQHVGKLSQQEQAKEREAVEARIQKIQKYFDDHKDMVTQTHKDFEAIINELDAISSAKDLTKKVSEDIEKLQDIIDRIVSITRIKLELASNAEVLKTELGDEGIVLISNLLDEQELISAQLDGVIEHLKDVIMLFKQ